MGRGLRVLGESTVNHAIRSLAAATALVALSGGAKGDAPGRLLSAEPHLNQVVTEYAQADPDSQEAEKTFWDAVKDSGDPDMIEAYLQSFPDGRFAAQAKSRLSDLHGGESPVSGAHPFIGTWASGRLDCARIDEMKGADRSSIDSFVVFGSGNTAEYYGHRRRHFKCMAADIATHADGYTLSAECSETYSLVGRPQSGTLKLRTDGDWLKGRGPDGHRKVLTQSCPPAATASQDEHRIESKAPATPNSVGITSEMIDHFDRLMVQLGRQIDRDGAAPADKQLTPAKLEAACHSAGFLTTLQCIATMSTLGVLYPSVDQTTGRHVDPRVLAKRQIAAIEANTALSADQRAAALAKARQHLQNLEEMFGPDPVPESDLRIMDDHMRRKQQTQSR